MSTEPEAFALRADAARNLSREMQAAATARFLQPDRTGLGRWADAGILLSVLLIGFMSYLTVRSMQQAEGDSDWVVHTQMVQKTLDSTLADTAEAMSGSRGFAATGQETLRDLAAQARRRLDSDMDTLRGLIADNADQRKRFGQLQGQVNVTLQSTLRIEAARRQTGTIPPSSEFVETKRCMDAVAATIAAMQDEEMSLFRVRRNTAQNARHSILIVVWLSAVVCMGLLTLCGFFLRRQINRGTRMEAQLWVLNANLERRSAESRRAEAEAKRNQLRLEGAAESSLDCLYLADAARDANGEIEDFVFTYLNENAIRLVTFSREQLIGRGMCEMFAINRTIGLLDRYKHVVLTGESFVGEFAVQEENIKTGWLRIQATKLGDGVAITASDITERKEQQEAMRRSEAVLARTERLTNSGGWEIDLATNEVFWSAEVHRIQGVPLDYRPTLKAVIECYIPEDRLRMVSAIKTAMAGGVGWDMECTLVRADGSRVPVRVVGGADFENGKLVRLSGAMQDISQQIKQRAALTAARDRLSLATDSGGIGIWEWDIANGTLCWDDWMYRIYGMQPREGEEPYELWVGHLHPEDREPMERQLQEGVDGIKPFNSVFRIQWEDGSVHYIHATAVAIRDEAGHATRMIGTNSDVTVQKEGEAAVAKLAEFMQSIIASSPFATLVTNLEGVIVSANPAAERMLLYRREELMNLETPLVLLGSQQVESRAIALSEELQCTIEPDVSVLTANPSRGKLEEAEWELIRRDGTRFDAQVTVSALTDSRSVIIGYILIAYDITERKRAQDYISHLAHHDELTGLPTRNLFRDRLDVALAHAMRYQRKIGILMVDLDNFKKVNDLLGHNAGDELLIVVARRLQSCLRASDTVARMGGDEFMVLLDELRGAEDADLVAEKIIRAMAMPVAIGIHTVCQTVSIGISVYPDGGTTAESLFTNADTAMYQAKAAGRNGRQIFSPELALAASRRKELEEGLSHALALNEFELVYQPQISIGTGKVSGVEALLRWRSGKLGLVMPAEFISLAEDNGMIVPIGEWILRTACHQGRQMQQTLDRPLAIAVNISPRQFQQNDLPLTIGKILAESELSPSSLEIEITENVLLGDLPRPKALLEEIRSLGVRVAIDDFGTGFSSMSYILRFRVDRLKIDRSFVREMTVDPDSRAITNAVIALAKGLRIPVVAEGVETALHRDALLQEGCDDAQGYYYSRPLPMEGICEAIYAIEHSGALTANA